MPPSYHSQRGSALVVAIFVIVVTGLLVATLSRLVATSSDSVVVEVYGTRAYTAAQSGLQQGMYELFPLNQPMANCAAVTGTPVDLSGIPSLANCSVTLSCQAFDYTADDTHYRIEALGQCEAGGQTTERLLAMEARTIE